MESKQREIGHQTQGIDEIMGNNLVNRKHIKSLVALLIEIQRLLRHIKIYRSFVTHSSSPA